MKKKGTKSINLNLNESPGKYAEKLGIEYAAKVSTEHKKKLGQFFTPLSIARFMSEFSQIHSNRIKILDPGCGVGILSTSLIEHIANSYVNVKIIELVAFETDVKLLPIADENFKYLGEWLKEKGIEFTFFLCKNDFILHNSHLLNKNNENLEFYDIIISNPPYFKLSKSDPRAIAAKDVIHGQSNIYTIFLLLASKLLSTSGKLIFIIPRSFCSGSYYRLFRELFFSAVEIKTIHLFNSRKDAFKKDKVLQENIVLTAIKKSIDIAKNDNSISDDSHFINISSSYGISDLNSRSIKDYKWNELINVNSNQKILHLPSNSIDEEIIKIFKTWTGSLKAYDFEISTGPVVDFRSKDMIFMKGSKSTVPLIWLNNVESMKFNWPITKGQKGKVKGQFIINSKKSFSRLVPNKNYVLLRRFSTKEDKRRLVAAPYFSDLMQRFSMLGIENHLNYIYNKNRNLKKSEVIGLSAVLNSRLFDLYFRTFNGNINVSATELRDFPLPALNLIQQLGLKIQRSKNSKTIDIDNLISNIFNISIDLSDNYG